MSNPTNKFDFSITLAAFLATVEGDGTIADVLDVLKTDRVGYEANASAISVAAGQRWSNLVDDFIEKVYELNPGRKDYNAIETIGAVNTDTVIATLATNGDAWRIGIVITGRTATDGELVSARAEGHFYRDAGTVNVLDPIHTVLATAPLSGGDADLVIVGDDVILRATGVAAKTIGWHARVEYAEQIA